MRYARSSSSFASFAKTRKKFWKGLQLREYPFRFLLPLFCTIRYSDRTGWLSRNPNNRFTGNKSMSLKPLLTAVMQQILPDLVALSDTNLLLL